MFQANQLKILYPDPISSPWPVDESVHLFDILRVFIQFRLHLQQLIHDGLRQCTPNLASKILEDSVGRLELLATFQKIEEINGKTWKPSQRPVGIWVMVPLKDWPQFSCCGAVTYEHVAESWTRMFMNNTWESGHLVLMSHICYIYTIYHIWLIYGGFLK